MWKIDLLLNVSRELAYIHYKLKIFATFLPDIQIRRSPVFPESVVCRAAIP